MPRCFFWSFEYWFLSTWSNALIIKIALLFFSLFHCLFCLQWCWDSLAFYGVWRSSYPREKCLIPCSSLYLCYSLLFVQRIKLLWLSHFIAAKGLGLDTGLQFACYKYFRCSSGQQYQHGTNILD